MPHLRLAGRNLVDVDGPHRWQYAAVNTGRAIQSDSGLGVPWGIREVLPLIELRISIELWIVEPYLAESFAFRVIGPGAAVHLKPKRGKK